MNLREALIVQGPSLELQRAAQAEIARLDARIKDLTPDKTGELDALMLDFGSHEFQWDSAGGVALQLNGYQIVLTPNGRWFLNDTGD
jgi:hypothetical protein